MLVYSTLFHDTLSQLNRTSKESDTLVCHSLLHVLVTMQFAVKIGSILSHIRENLIVLLIMDNTMSQYLELRYLFR